MEARSVKQFVLHPYQKEGVKLLEQFNGRALLADQMGLGKTAQALQYMVNHPEDDTVIIICPASLKLHWEREAKVLFGLRVNVLDTTTPPPDGSFQTRRGIYCINYDVLEGRKKKNGTTSPGWINWLLKLKPKLLVVDESHYCKNPRSKRARAVKKLSKVAEKMIAISGTPGTSDKLAELWPILNMLWPKKFPFFRPFGFKYCGPVRTHFGIQFPGATNIKSLHKRLRKYGMIRRLKKDVLKDLPPKQRTVIPIELSPQARKEYDEAEKDTIGWLRRNYSVGAAKAAERAEAMAKVGYLKRLAARLKLKQCVQWINDTRESSGEKLILFAIHKKIVARLKEEYTQAAVVTGDVIGSKRQGEFDRFNTKKSCDIFIGNIIAAGVGWSAKRCSISVFLELDWLPGNHTQAEDRCHGLGRGQEGVVSQSYYLVAKGTIEERLCKRLQKRQETLDKVLDGRKHEGLNLFDDLVNSLMGKVL
jgi:SWI/SNF-related matrix-associated actin-dependent regulator 1 of chromatin subfamily A